MTRIFIGTMVMSCNGGTIDVTIVAGLSWIREFRATFQTGVAIMQRIRGDAIHSPCNICEPVIAGVISSP